MKRFVSGLLRDLLHSFGILLFAFMIGTAGTAIVCLYYGIPLMFSLFGGLVVLGIAVIILTAHPFS